MTPADKPSVSVLGAGNMGTALGHVLAGNGHDVRLWSIEEDVLEDVRDNRRNSKYLKHIELSERIQSAWKLEEAAGGAGIVLFSVTSQVLRAVARDVAPHLPAGCIVLNVAKGLEEGSDLRLSRVLGEELGDGRPMVCMGGPAMASQFAAGVPTAVIVGSDDPEAAKAVQQAFQNEFFKVETTDDLVGVELCATLKNAYAIALGICDGMGLAMNTKSLLVPLALSEMASLVEALGGRRQTAYGLAGLGDLITTGFSADGRNRRLGETMGSGGDWREFMKGPTLEGVPACHSARGLAHKHGVETPLLDVIYTVLCGEQEPREAMQSFLREFDYNGR
ncbi:MAG: NAD(P)H-dependent glycerol-3-phosphate dehydrogenase [Chloroflexi bacterium]|nr:MAG: NAD(P)H-dependent glycerol-3-phosphate dehydrogenase [Chloroflexota bacterium]